MVIRSQLTRNIGMLYSEIRDEIVTAFDEILGLKDDGECLPTEGLTYIDLKYRVEGCTSIKCHTKGRLQDQ